ncbi:NOP protein chaperone 1-like [Haliotis asinina]|uniref:NOP protein chaperone 1-like n=1 Tax=Haliotis asinina TaxID=109174 RepID=UPI0035323D4D
MAATMADHVFKKQENIMSSQTNTMNETDNKSTKQPLASKQLLYSEKFSDCSLDKLKIHKQVADGRRGPEQGKQTFRVPPSSVLSQVKSFLPQLESSNLALAHRLEAGESSKVNIESVDPGSGPVIEMNLGLVEIDSDSDSDDSGISDSESESGSDSVIVLDDSCMGPVTESNIRLSKPKDSKSKGAIIEVLSSSDEASSSICQREITPKNSEESCDVDSKKTKTFSDDECDEFIT